MALRRWTLASRLWLNLYHSFFFKYSNLHVRAPSGGDIEIDCQRAVKKKKKNSKSLSNSISNPPCSPPFGSGAGMEFIVSTLARIDQRGGERKRLLQELSSHLEKLRPRLFISSLWCYSSSGGSPHCSLRCVTYGKQWISQCTVCSQNMLWLTFHWSRLSLRLPAKIVAVHFGRLPVWIYGGVSLSQDWWLVWVAVADCWVFCPMISASHFVRVHPLFPKLVIQGSRGNKWRGSKERIQQNDSSESCAPAVCIMYNACARACNKQHGGVVRCPIGGSWTSAPTPEFPKI